MGAALVATVLTWSCGTTRQQVVEPPAAVAATSGAPTATATTAAVATTTTTIPATPVTTVPETTTTAAPATTTTSPAPAPAPAEVLLAAWLLNGDGEPAAVISDSEAIPVNVQSVDLVEVNGVAYMHVTASGIPDYGHTLSAAEAAFLAGRPRARTDFVGGAPVVGAGDVIDFGQDLGYRSTDCTDTPGSGYGFWPPGPACPTRQDWDVWFPVTPVEAEVGATTGLWAMGLWVNGVAVFNWGDGQSWQQERVWWNLAPAAEVYDLDICPGHSAMGNYHHHSHPTCLAEQLGDDGSAHSPVYGFAADGVPIAGPWVDDDSPARSSWRIRDYAEPDSPTGCGTPGVRDCLLVDQLDASLGTTPTDRAGPTTSTAVTSQSGNPFVAEAGWFMQDWWYDPSLDDGGARALDEHNGHLGPLPGLDEPRYHYHVTRERRDDGTMADVFPYYVGPTYWGELHDNALTGGVDRRPGRGGRDRPPPGADDDMPAPNGNIEAAAEQLGVSVQALQDALGPPPPELGLAAEILGVTVDHLRSLLPPTPPRP